MNTNNNGGRERERERRDTPPSLPAAVTPTMLRGNSQHREYAQSALETAQRYVDQVNQITELTRELDEWRAKAMAAEAEVERFAKREHELLATIDRKNEEFYKARSHINETIAVLKTQFTTASNILLDSMKSVDELESIKPSIDPPDDGKNTRQRHAALHAIASEIGDVVKGNES